MEIEVHIEEEEEGQQGEEEEDVISVVNLDILHVIVWPLLQHNQKKIYPKFIDAHTHVDYILQQSRKSTYPEFQASVRFPANYEGVISVHCDPAAFSPSLCTWRDQLELPDVYGAFGIHPHNAKYYTDQLEERITEAILHPKAVGWGETGLDYHGMRSEKEVQKTIFARQILKAVEFDKALIVHSRDASEDTFLVLKEFLPVHHPVHIHCFSDGAEEAKRLMDNFTNLFIGFTGNITYRG
eukprot:TRINITY_DN3683_c0_g1_i1.p1 TRINITY_DN3683_c0_g1~~TRINITY_DN3683_c0_g1_i1.p1  ORF type:complete len:240 (-),score=59.56 TRINITY_DN3683_c0_g1_i1:158-877(-)